MSWFSEWTPHLVLLWVLLGVLLVVFGYLARVQVHRLIERAARGGQRWLKLAGRGCAALSQRINTRNREVMLALQYEITRRQLEREFHRVAAAVEQDMTRFQHLERAITEHITVLAEDFERSTQVPPAAPGWIAAVDAIAKLQAENNPEAVARVLSDIHTSVQDQQRETMREYRWAVNARHKILADLRPLWRRAASLVEAVGRDSRDLLARAHRIDTLMSAFRELCANRVDARIESFLARWLVALLLTGAAAGLAIVNAALLARPLALILGPASAAPAGVVAGAYTLAVVAVALLLSEVTQVTRLLPLIGGLPRNTRIPLTAVVAALLVALAAGESLLLVEVDALAGLYETASWSLAGLGFLLPLMLALLSPALESLLATSRPVLAALTAQLLGFCAVLLRLAARLWLELGRLVHHLFDLAIIVPTAAVEALERRRRMRQGQPEPTAPPAVNVTAVNFEKGRKAE
jgi:hypothetical protein